MLVKNTVVFFLLSFLCLISCTNKEIAAVPENIIHSDTLVEVLSEIHRANAYLSLNNNGKSFDHNAFVGNVLKKHNISKEVFDTSLNFYISNPVILDSLYDKVIAKLSTIKASITDNQAKQNKKQ